MSHIKSDICPASVSDSSLIILIQFGVLIHCKSFIDSGYSGSRLCLNIRELLRILILSLRAYYNHFNSQKIDERSPPGELPKQRSPPKQLTATTVSPKQMEELMALRSQLRDLRQRNDQMQTEIRGLNKTNSQKRNTNANLRQNFKKLHEEMEVLKQKHLLKVQENLKSQHSPVSALVQENGFGVSPFALMKLPSFRYQKKQEADICMACYEELQNNVKCKTLPSCTHTFHAQCIDQYLLVSKQCPACGVAVTFS